MAASPIRRLARLFLFLGAAVVCVVSSGSAQPGLEYEVKAAFLYNFFSFVTWPTDALASASDPVRLCVFDPDPFGPVLDRTVAGGVAEGHPIAVQRVPDGQSLLRCSLVFVPRSAAAHVDQVIRATAKRAVLTVGESPDFLKKGGMIEFVIDGGRVRFDVNAKAAAANGLSLSSRLLRVARSTTGAGA